MGTFFRADRVAAVIGGGLTATLLLFGASPSAHGALERMKPAVVTSVDGPQHLTLKTAKGKALRVRLAGVDGPTQNECGAEASAATLRRVMKKYRGRVRYELAVDDGRPVVDADGRQFAQVTIRLSRHKGWARYGESLADSLIEKGWAQSGAAESAPVAERLAAGNISSEVEESWYLGRPASGGLWTSCGGRLHLPAGTQPEPLAPAPWSIDRHGITRSIGGVPLPSTLDPEGGLRLGTLRRELGPMEVSGGDGGCYAVAPHRHLGIMTFGSESSQPCDQQLVFILFTFGPNAVPTDRGFRTGDPVDRLTGLFDNVTADEIKTSSSEDYGGISLGPGGYVPFAWQTGAGVNRSGKITEFISLVISSPERPGE